MGSRSRSGRTWPGRVSAALGFFAAAVALAGCGATIGDYAPTAIGGLPEGTPKRPTQSSAYPAVHDMPPPRATQVLTDAERNKLEGDLAAARERAAAAAKPAGDDDKPTADAAKPTADAAKPTADATKPTADAAKPAAGAAKPAAGAAKPAADAAKP